MGKLSRALLGQSNTNTVEIDEGILSALQEISNIRGVDVETIVRFQLHAYIRAFEKGRIIDLGTKMPYGKYEGLLLEEIIRVDPRYIAYLQSNSENFRLSDAALKLLESVQ